MALDQSFVQCMSWHYCYQSKITWSDFGPWWFISVKSWFTKLHWPQTLSLSLPHIANMFYINIFPKPFVSASSVMSDCCTVFTILLDYGQMMTHTHGLEHNYYNGVQHSRNHRVRLRVHTLTCMNKASFPSGLVLQPLQTISYWLWD